MAPQLAWIGLGNMGRGMCKNLVQKGDLSEPLIIFNRTTKRAEELKNSLPNGKTNVATDIGSAVSQADIIFTCVGDDTAINETIDAALKKDVKEKLFVDCSTVHPGTSEALAKRVVAAGAEFVAGPVFGTPVAAEAGYLLCVLAGPSQSVERVKPYIKGVIGAALVDFSNQPVSKAGQLKIVGNTFIINMIEALSEGLVLAEKSGLGIENLMPFIETIFPGPYVDCAKQMTSGDYHKKEKPAFAVDLARKDAGHALAMAKDHGSRLNDVEVADAHLAVVKERMGQRGDLVSIYGVVREEAGLKFENN